MLLEVTDKLYVGNVADFGDGKALEARGIQFAVGSHGHANFPHTNLVASAEFHIRADGSNPDLFIQGIARLLSHAYDKAVMALTDQAGGVNHASFLIACTYAQKLGTSFDAGLAWLQDESRLPAAAPTAELIAQGQRLWP